jgi:hypothetical protein
MFVCAENWIWGLLILPSEKLSMRAVLLQKTPIAKAQGLVELPHQHLGGVF